MEGICISSFSGACRPVIPNRQPRGRMPLDSRERQHYMVQLPTCCGNVSINGSVFVFPPYVCCQSVWLGDQRFSYITSEWRTMESRWVRGVPTDINKWNTNSPFTLLKQHGLLPMRPGSVLSVNWSQINNLDLLTWWSNPGIEKGWTQVDPRSCGSNPGYFSWSILHWGSIWQ